MSISIELMRWVDNQLGRPLCYLLSCYAWIKHLFLKKKVKPVKTILFTKYLSGYLQSRVFTGGIGSQLKFQMDGISMLHHLHFT